MKYKLLIIIGLVVALFTYFFFVVNRDKQNSNAQQQTNENSFETKTDEQGQVSVKVTPQGFSGAQWKFDVVFDTHSVELNQDLMQAVVLVDDRGNEYQLTTWEGSEPGGHHREGQLVFNAINPLPVYVELKIQDVGGIAERSFRWDINQ
jgi:hypothetical protein